MTANFARTRLLGLLLLLPALLAAPARADDYGADSGDDSKTESQLQAEVFMAKGDWQPAAPLLEAHVAGFPADDEAVAELGHVYDRLGDKEMARMTLESAVWINPRSLEGNLYLGEYEIGMKDFTKARERLEVLDRICIFGCGEYRTLKRELAALGQLQP
jgi:tetratricopeptide (TPR) repeat protein